MEKILGQALKKEREMRGISLAEIAAETRIGTRFLQAMEDEQFDLFPGDFYIHYYIKNYLKACGADDTAFFNTYQAYLKNVLKKGDGLPPDQYLNKMAYLKFRKSKRMLLVFLSLAILALLAYLLLGPARWLDKFLGGTEAAASEIPAFSNSLLDHEADFCLTGPPIAALMAFDAPCWLQLWRGGEKVQEKIFHKGEVFSLNGYQLTMVIANPQALRLKLNGQEVSYFRRSPIALKLVINPENLQEILQR
jgi:transcriptional regulator with XRE-family HTH domain